MTGGAHAVGRTDEDDVRPAAPEAAVRAVPAAPVPPGPAQDDPPSDEAPPPLPGATTPATPPPGGAPQAEPAARGRRGRRRRGPGLRERRRQQTRATIVDAAAELFAERGFDAVSVVEIAQRAGVVEKTVFNHFPVKEGLVFEADPPMRAALLDAVRTRPAGESVTAAAGTFVVRAMGGLGAPEAAAGVAEMARVIRGSRTLQVREREILGELTTALAELIAEETRAEPGELAPWLAAHAVLSLYAGLLELARDRVLAGMTGPELSAELLARGGRGLALLQFGLAGYAKRR
ncbi:TetR/AcrR family transcriptional regulator [Geodermatophilus sp. TF02-6]|uniref:TetR/AcrR family transcriptional regulator n=1 Tax=Geodermatophilus sp. TF02-6 TaxID=2250575 RepID=UPI000DEBE013|nr:TetR/AcrR family transcriptional regulator [Geodermatophilus sp. TF02-6]RBY78797.1 TetR/AcrR family transcriptional regulator [Geodermatophilus sp. TF02-6]